MLEQLGGRSVGETAKVEMLCLGKTAPCLLFLVCLNQTFQRDSPDSGCEAMKEQAEGVAGREREEIDWEEKLKEEEEERKELRENWEGRRHFAEKSKEKEEGKELRRNWKGRRFWEGKLKEEVGKELRCSQCGRRKEKIVFLRKPFPGEEKTFGYPGCGEIEKGSSAMMMMQGDTLKGGKVEREEKDSPGRSESSSSEKRQVSESERRRIGIFDSWKNPLGPWMAPLATWRNPVRINLIKSDDGRGGEDDNENDYWPGVRLGKAVGILGEKACGRFYKLFQS